MAISTLAVAPTEEEALVRIKSVDSINENVIVVPSRPAPASCADKVNIESLATASNGADNRVVDGVGASLLAWPAETATVCVAVTPPPAASKVRFQFPVIVKSTASEIPPLPELTPNKPKSDSSEYISSW